MSALALKKVMESLYNGFGCRVVCDNQLTGTSNEDARVKQRFIISTFLFILTMERLTKLDATYTARYPMELSHLRNYVVYMTLASLQIDTLIFKRRTNTLVKRIKHIELKSKTHQMYEKEHLYPQSLSTTYS